MMLRMAQPFFDKFIRQRHFSTLLLGGAGRPARVHISGVGGGLLTPKNTGGEGGGFLRRFPYSDIAFLGPPPRVGPPYTNN